MSAPLSFAPLVGLRLGGAALTPYDDLAPDTGTLGRPVWGPRELLADLELRLGLPRDEAPAALREQAFAARLKALVAPGKFWAASFGVDPSGTAAALLAWRDGLVDSGWDGAPIAGGGGRLGGLAEVEALCAPALPAGTVDRLVRVERALAAGDKPPPYDAVSLAEPGALWSARWRRVFALLEARGASFAVIEPRFEAAPAGTDLGRIQALMRGEEGPTGPLAGDGTLLLLRAPTSWELGETVAALLRAEGPARGSTVVIRGGEQAALDAGLAAQGMASLGLASASPRRPALQVLPLAIELAFEPRDPYRVLELLTLAVSPFQGRVGRELARALTEAPGIDGPEWRAAKAKLREPVAGRSADELTRIERRLARVEQWLEAPGVPRGEAAPRERLVEVAARVEEWLRARVALDSADSSEQAVLGAAYAQARAFRQVLADDVRPALSLVEARTLGDRVTSAGQRIALAHERAGRLDHVDEPGALLVTRDTVVFWHAVAGTERRAFPEPWREPEREALSAAGVELPDIDARLADENTAWRRAVLAARARVIFAVPDTAAGSVCAPHPLWEEIVARLRADEAAVASLTRTAHQLRAARLPLAPAPGANLPPGRVEWRLPASAARAADVHSASSLDELLRCPLRWTLKRRAKLYAGAVAQLPPDHKLAGTIGHRLVETLHVSGKLTTDAAELRRAAAAALETLLREEGTPWLLPGRAFDREQKKAALIHAVERLAAGLSESGLTVEAVEESLEAPWGERTLQGRADLLARDAAGRRVIVDLKWGASSYRDLLRAGLALQLAVYARAAAAGRPVPAGYFSLKATSFLTTEPGLFADVEPLDGPSPGETLDRAERTLGLVEEALRQGRVPAAGVASSQGLLPVLGVAPTDEARYLDYRKAPDGACQYCDHDAICGKAWESLR